MKTIYKVIIKEEENEAGNFNNNETEKFFEKKEDAIKYASLNKEELGSDLYIGDWYETNHFFIFGKDEKRIRQSCKIVEIGLE